MKLVEISDFCNKPISDYWQELPLPKEIFGDTLSYISQDGIQLVTSLKNYNGLKIIHVTVVPVALLGGK